MTDSLTIFDTTLRDGEQAPGASMTLDEKLQIAHHLAKLKVDVVEAGFPVSSPGQAEAVRRIAAEVEGPTTCALARTAEQDIDAAGEALADGTDTRIHTFVATSDIHLNAKFNGRFGSTMKETRAGILDMLQDAVRQARTYTDNVEFSAEDAGRTDPGFLREVIVAAAEAGATTINIPDTTGYCTPESYTELFTMARKALPEPDAVVLSTHCHDDLGLAVANSLAGVRAGARQVECTINGIGERAGNAALEEIAMALHVRQDDYNVQTSIVTEHLTEASRLVSTASGFPVQPNKAIVGRNAFSHEAGIHQHGVLEERETYEIMSAADVGQSEEQIRLGRHSGRHGLFSRLDRLGFDVPEDDAARDAIYDRFTDLADRKKEIFDEDLYRLMDQPSPTATDDAYTLEHVAVSIDTSREPEATVRIRTGDNGTTAIDHAAQEGHSLIDYTIRSISEGADAQGEVHVTIRHGEHTFDGGAHGTDVLKASAQAYVDALNRLADFRSDEESTQFVVDGIMHAFNGEEGVGER
jgi:2-isopropylmalate synthase